MKKLRTNHILTLFCIAAVLLFTHWVNDNLSSYYVRILQFWGIYLIFGIAFQLVYGYTGQLSLGHAGLIAVGAYTIAVLTLSREIKATSYLLKPPMWPINLIEWPFLPSLILAGLLTALVGFLVASPALRLRGDYLAMVTLGFAEVIRLLIVNSPSFANGSMGLIGIPMVATPLLTWTIAIMTVFVLRRLASSSFGRAFKSIKEDEIASEALGIDIFRHKLIAFLVSSFFAGIGGGLLASVLGTIDPNTLRMQLTYAAITIVVLGGMQSITGCVIASGIYTIASELLREAEAPKTIWGINFPGIPGMRVEVFGLMLLLLILYMRKGLLGSREFSWEWLHSCVLNLRTRLKRLFTSSQQTGGQP